MVKFYEYNTFADNYGMYSAVYLKQCNVTFYGNTTFLQNDCRYGGALYAEETKLNFQESVMFLENEGEYGGALMLHHIVSVIIEQFAEVSFVKNRAEESCGAVYARESQITIRSGQKLTFVENEGYDGGAITLTGATFLNETYTLVLVHNHCPFDYSNDGNIQLNMEHPDEQCALSCSGVLCGSCQQNLSHILGSSNCKQCSSYFLLLFPVFIFAGIALVAFLMLTITAFSFTLLEYPDGSVKRIWLYDGNVEYLKGKHIALFVAAVLLLVFISLPYTAALLFIQCLQYRSKCRILAWVRRLKPLFDAYTGPYKDKHRYRPGLLVVRVVLFLVFSVNVFGDPAVSLLTIIVTTFCIYFSQFSNLWRHLQKYILH